MQKKVFHYFKQYIQMILSATDKNESQAMPVW